MKKIVKFEFSIYGRKRYRWRHTATAGLRWVTLCTTAAVLVQRSVRDAYSVVWFRGANLNKS